MDKQLANLPIYAIFVLILMISANFLGTTFPCRVQKLLSENIFMKHLLGFFTMIFFIMISGPLLRDTLYDNIIAAFIMYLFFILVTKTPIQIFILIFILLMINYICILYLYEFNKKNDKSKFYIKKKQAEILIIILNFIIICLTLLGVTIYMGAKKIEYGKKFSYYKFFFNDENCKFNSPKISLFKSI